MASPGTTCWSPSAAGSAPMWSPWRRPATAEASGTSACRPPDSIGVLQAGAAALLAELACNPYEEGHRARLLDFGHTFSPAVEERSGWAVPHGEAVAVDLAVSCPLGGLLGLTEPAATARV